MKLKLAVGLGLLAVSGGAFAQAITPTYTTFGALPGAAFSGTGIPNSNVAITTTTFGVTLGLTATQRFSNPALANDGMGTFTALAGIDTHPPSTTADPYARWNIGYYAQGNTTLYDFRLVYDFNPAVGNAQNTHGNGTIITTFGSGAINQNSANMGFNYLGNGIPGFVTPPPGATVATFNPTLTGQYSFALVAYNRLTNAEVARSAILVSVVPEPGTYALLLAGLAIVGSVARRRMH